MVGTVRTRFPKPRFDDLLKNYKTHPETVHTCAILNPTERDDGINTCAARMSEALCISNSLVSDRMAIRASRRTGGGRTNQPETFPLLGNFNYRMFGNLCDHGIARGARDLGEFLMYNWGSPREFRGLTQAPEEIQYGQGVVCFVKIPGYGGQGHIDLWNQTDCVGHGYWNADKVWFWRMA